jgi:hypothetical protein
VPESIGEPFGTLQEFLVGNKWVGGVYFQVYTLGDNEKIRVIESEPVPLSKTDYSELLRLIDTKAFPKVFGDRRVFSPKGNTTDNTTPLPKPKHKRVR